MLLCAIDQLKNIVNDIKSEVVNAVQPLTTATTTLIQSVNGLAESTDRIKINRAFNAKSDVSVHNNNLTQPNSNKRKHEDDSIDHGPAKISKKYNALLTFGTDGLDSCIKGVPPMASQADIFNSMKGFRGIFVSRLSTSTTNEMVVGHLINKKVIGDASEVKCVKLVSPKRDINDLSFVSFKLLVPESKFASLSDPKIWPSSVAVREFVNQPRRNLKIASLSDPEPMAVGAVETVNLIDILIPTDTIEQANDSNDPNPKNK